MPSNRPKSVQDLLSYIERLEQAQDILYSIWTENGPYAKQLTLTKSTSEKLNNHFKFDDSE